MYFFTGGCGFIGSNAIAKVINLFPEAKIVVYDNLVNGKLKYISKYLENGKVTFIEGDILDLDKMKSSMKGCSTVFHFAANADIALSAQSTYLDVEQTTIGTYHVLEAMRVVGAREIVYSSGSGVYGDTRGVPASENYSPLAPVSMYGATKLSAEAMICAYADLFGIKSYIYRFANVVGRFQTHGVAYDFINRLKENNSVLYVKGNGYQRKPYIHVDDVLNAIFLTRTVSNDLINIFNVSSSTTTDVREIVRLVCRLMDIQCEVHYEENTKGWPGDVALMLLDDSKLRKLGWSENYDSNGALSRAIVENINGGL